MKFLLIVSKVDVKLNENLKVGYICTKPETKPENILGLLSIILEFLIFLKNIVFFKFFEKY